MSATQEDYERIGRRIDGEDVDLTEAQRALAEEIAADEAGVGAALAVSLPGGTLHRVSARVRRALPGRRRARAVRWAAAAAAVAAAVAMAALLTTDTNGVEPSEYVAHFLHAPSGELEARADMLADELAEYQVHLAVGDEWGLEVAVNGLEQELGELIPAEDPAAWELPEGSL
jgi:hypothetical protein